MWPSLDVSGAKFKMCLRAWISQIHRPRALNCTAKFLLSKNQTETIHIQSIWSRPQTILMSNTEKGRIFVCHLFENYQILGILGIIHSHIGPDILNKHKLVSIITINKKSLLRVLIRNQFIICRTFWAQILFNRTFRLLHNFSNFNLNEMVNFCILILIKSPKYLPWFIFLKSLIMAI